jgi:ribonuclease J
MTEPRQKNRKKRKKSPTPREASGREAKSPARSDRRSTSRKAASKKPAGGRQRLRVIPLGGLEEVGKNMTVVEYGDEMVLIDAGLMFPDEDMPGVDLVLPDYSYVLERQEKLRGIVLTHGHEDHVGALPYLLADLERTVPVLGTRLTLGLVAEKLEERGVGGVRFREVEAGQHVNMGVFGFDFIAVNHSIPDGVALFIKTPVGNILHTGDFKFDQTPIDGRATDYAALTKAGQKGVLLLMSDSTNAERPGTVRPEAEVGRTLRQIFAGADQRIIVASFASHIHRIQQVCDAAVDCGRKVIVTGRSMIQNVRISRELGYLDIEEDDLRDAYDIGDLAPDEIVVLSTGSQGEPLSALARMANADHKTVVVQEGDTVVISAAPVPGNEKAVSRVINRLFKAGADVYHRSISDVHVSGHGAAEELKMMLNLTKPRYFMPIHGETRHLRAHAVLAEEVGIPAEHVFVLENGEPLELTESTARVGKPVTSGVVYVDGLRVGDVSSVVLRDRQVLSQDGIVSVVVAIDRHDGSIASEPELVMRGVALGEPDPDLLAEARRRLSKALARTASEGVTDRSVVERAVKDSLSTFMWERSRSRPIVIPVVMEV